MHTTLCNLQIEAMRQFAMWALEGESQRGSSFISVPKHEDGTSLEINNTPQFLQYQYVIVYFQTWRNLYPDLILLYFIVLYFTFLQYM